MPRPVILFTGQWADLPLVELAPKVSDWGYQGLELCCWGDHFEGLHAFGDAWRPILDACRDAGLRFALEVHPGQVAFDLVSAEMVLDYLDGRDEFGFTLDPSHLFWQGVDPVEFVRRFPDRIYHVHVKDVALTLNGRTSILNGYLPHGDPRRGWEFRAPGHGGVDWEGLIRALNDAGYDGPL